MVLSFKNCSYLLGEKNVLWKLLKFDTEGQELLRPELENFVTFNCIQAQSGKND